MCVSEWVNKSSFVSSFFFFNMNFFYTNFSQLFTLFSRYVDHLIKMPSILCESKYYGRLFKYSLSFVFIFWIWIVVPWNLYWITQTNESSFQNKLCSWIHKRIFSNVPLNLYRNNLQNNHQNSYLCFFCCI